MTNAKQRNCSFCLAKKREGVTPPSASTRDVVVAGPKRAFEVKDSAQARVLCRCSRSSGQLAVGCANMDNRARHACKCKADSPVGNGFIFAVDLSCLFARAVVNS